MLLIYPPAAKPCEAPPGIASLAGALQAHGQPCTVFDANIEGLLFLIRAAASAGDPWSRRACRHRETNLAALRSPELYAHPARYRRAVADVNHLLELKGRAADLSLTLSNYQERELSPTRSGDLILAAERPETNIFHPWFNQRLAEILDHSAPSTVGFSVNYLSQALTALAMIGWLRRHCPGIRIVAGGGLITSWMSNPLWKEPFAGLIDHCIAGPGEAALLALVGKQRCHCSWPDYSGFALGDYLAPGFILPYAASSGCYWRKCTFCPEPAEGSRYTPEVPHRTISNLHRLSTATRPVLLHLLDNAISPALMTALAADGPGIPWYGFARIDEILTDIAFCRSLSRSGCRMLKLGIESGSQRVLDAMVKGTDLDLVSRVLAALQEAGIATYVYLLFGTPTEALPEARETLAFVSRHSAAITFLNLAIFNLPLAGSEAATLTRLDTHDGDLSLYSDFVHPRGWDRRAVRCFLDREFRRHPPIAKILAADPPLFTSNHAPFFCAGPSRSRDRTRG